MIRPLVAREFNRCYYVNGCMCVRACVRACVCGIVCARAIVCMCLCVIEHACVHANMCVMPLKNKNKRV